ncbi:LysR family transcriptional regulator [Phyllobacterium sp. SB3]|uniref:LysR family transcriptional regulator n=1 Tax=Phyllobacterium sp. SB3 TaxID=3156073 RepID=UPI0032AEA577
MDRLAGIEEFVAVVDAGSFSAAADKLHLSRSAVGKTIARLEERLGVRLCQRTTRSFKLTDDGHSFYEHCQTLLATLDSAETVIASGKNVVSGRLRLSLPVLFGRRCVAPVLFELARQYPSLRLEVSFTDRPVDLVAEGYDLVVRNAGLPDTTNLAAKRIARQRMTVCASPAYLMSHGTPETIEDIAAHQAILYGQNGNIRSWLFPNDRKGFDTASTASRIILDDLEAVADAAVGGMGLAWLPCWLIRDQLETGKLKRLLPDVGQMVFDTHAVWPRQPYMPTRIRVAIDALATTLPGMTGVDLEIK